MIKNDLETEEKKIILFKSSQKTTEIKIGIKETVNKLLLLYIKKFGINNFKNMKFYFNNKMLNFNDIRAIEEVFFGPNPLITVIDTSCVIGA